MVGLLLLPLARNLWVLLGVVILCQFCQNLARPYEPLHNEVVPPPQRGRTRTLRSIMQNLLGIFFTTMLLAQFDWQSGLASLGGRFPVNGEKTAYWVGRIPIGLGTERPPWCSVVKVVSIPAGPG
jgi:hypothetical protein